MLPWPERLRRCWRGRGSHKRPSHGPGGFRLLLLIHGRPCSGSRQSHSQQRLGPQVPRRGLPSLPPPPTSAAPTSTQHGNASDPRIGPRRSHQALACCPHVAARETVRGQRRPASTSHALVRAAEAGSRVLQKRTKRRRRKRPDAHPRHRPGRQPRGSCSCTTSWASTAALECGATTRSRTKDRASPASAASAWASASSPDWERVVTSLLDGLLSAHAHTDAVDPDAVGLAGLSFGATSRPALRLHKQVALDWFRSVIDRRR